MTFDTSTYGDFKFASSSLSGSNFRGARSLHPYCLQDEMVMDGNSFGLNARGAKAPDSEYLSFRYTQSSKTLSIAVTRHDRVAAFNLLDRILNLCSPRH